MDWTDLIDTAFDVAGNSSSSTRAEALRTVEASVAADEKPVASTAGRHPDHFRKGYWSSRPTGCSSSRTANRPSRFRFPRSPTRP
ncbi:hypothetical protein ACFQ0M_21020 [Kitasatospora aburaviensis]